MDPDQMASSEASLSVSTVFFTRINPASAGLRVKYGYPHDFNFHIIQMLSLFIV